MNIETIRAFLEVASTGSFLHAADNLSITQSAMSARIKNLEEHLNRQLFTRKRTGATLTNGGLAFHKHALTLVQAWELAKQESALSAGVDAMVGMGVQLNHWQTTAAPWLQWMKENAPHIATQVHSDYSDRLMSMLRNGLISAAVLYEPQRNPDLVIEEYVREKLILVCTYPRQAQPTPVEGYVYVDWGQRFRSEHSRRFPDNPTHQMTVGLSAVALSHILEQGGSGYFLESEVTELLAGEQLFRVTDAPEFSLTTYLAYFTASEETEAVQTALRGLQAMRSE